MKGRKIKKKKRERKFFITCQGWRDYGLYIQNFDHCGIPFADWDYLGSFPSPNEARKFAKKLANREISPIF